MREPPLILAVDDTPDNLDILRLRLEAQGYEVVDAADGEEGLAKARDLRPDLVLLDIMMPKRDGISVVREMKANPDLRHIPVILVTAKADTKDVVLGLDAGGDDYLTKPFEHAALLARVRSMLRQKTLHDTVQEQAREIARWNSELQARVEAQVSEIERIGRLRRFLPPQIADLVVSSPEREDAVLSSQRRDVSVVFCDLRGFTSFAETSEPEEVMAVLRDYHACLGSLISEYEGTLSGSSATASSFCSTPPRIVPTTPRERCGWPLKCAIAWPGFRRGGGAAATSSGSTPIWPSSAPALTS